MTETTNPYIDKWGVHYGQCDNCGEEGELWGDCIDCDIGEVVPYDDDPDPDQ